MMFILASSVLAGEIYSYKDKKGRIVISNEPVPDEYADKVNKIESFTPDSPEEIERYNRQRTEKERRSEEISRRNRENYEAKRGSEQKAEQQKHQQQEELAKKAKAAEEAEEIYCFTSIIGADQGAGSMWRICRNKKTKKLISKERL